MLTFGVATCSRPKTHIDLKQRNFLYLERNKSLRVEYFDPFNQTSSVAIKTLMLKEVSFIRVSIDVNAKLLSFLNGVLSKLNLNCDV